ncbi:hypothetical protein DPMN_149361 [Dreissena polymorpha]|uniref:DUF4456 domain-containing protein n=1 Tax=Dreissena polymorpha TaxID=45954 RepID=A0A9D4J2D3_DREPO|nr:hypothetical protein DPMN_149361 [Dreissena polymorpha]
MFKWVAHIPELVVSDLLKDHVEAGQTSRTEQEGRYKQQLTDLKDRQKQHEQSLRPSLGHPHQQGILTELCNQETDRHNKYLAAVEAQTKALQNNAMEHARVFLEKPAAPTMSRKDRTRNVSTGHGFFDFHDDLTKIVTSRVLTRENCHYIHSEKNAPPTGDHVFSPISTIFELVRDIN